MAKRKGKGRARNLRQNMTDAERKLWYALRDRRFEHYKFRRQHPVGRYITDFACLEAHLIIEVDGGQHAESKHDERRTAFLETEGFKVIRFWNNDVMANLDGVLVVIAKELKRCCPSPRPSPQRGEGEEE